MPPKQTKPRKTPRQARSRAMVETILEATARVLVARGYKGTTTIRVAERAGVSIGSLYQYFPNKDALVIALVDRHVRDMVACVESAIAGVGASDPRAAVRAFVRAGLDAHRIDPALHKILIEEVPRVGRMAKAMDTSKKITALLEQYFAAHEKHLVVRDLHVAAFVVETAVEALTHRAVIEANDLVGTERLERETTDLVIRYLFGPTRRATSASRSRS